MSQHLTVELPDGLYAALRRRAEVEGKSVQEITLDCVSQRVSVPTRGAAEALLPFKGAWQMTPDERLRIEQMIHEERHMESEYQ